MPNELIFPAVMLSLIIYVYIIFSMIKDIWNLKLSLFEKVIIITSLIFVPPLGILAWVLLYYVYGIPLKGEKR